MVWVPCSKRRLGDLIARKAHQAACQMETGCHRFKSDSDFPDVGFLYPEAFQMVGSFQNSKGLEHPCRPGLADKMGNVYTQVRAGQGSRGPGRKQLEGKARSQDRHFGVPGICLIPSLHL